MAMHRFQGVTVGFPTKTGGSRAQGYESQNTEWVTWTMGELKIDSASFLTIFSPGGAGNPVAKPLGCLTGAVATGDARGAGSPRTFVITTDDAVHGFLRATFSSHSDEAGFERLARMAEVAAAGRSRRSSILCGRQSTGGADEICNPQLLTLLAADATELAGRWPLVYGPAELYGPDPGGEVGSEVLLGRGVVCLIDPADDSASRVGAYELRFYGEGDPAARWVIGPRMTLGEPSLIQDSGCGPAAIFELSVPGEPQRQLAFDREAAAAAFARDFRVRHRLMALSLKTSRSLGAADMLRSEVIAMQRRGLLPTLRIWIWWLAVLLALAVVVQTVMLLHADSYRRPLAGAVAEAVQTTRTSLSTAVTSAAAAGEAACQLLSRQIPASALQRCTELTDGLHVKRCVASLAAASYQLGSPYK
eukprot:gnl/TRDRNA2_/TRDRNA2_185860_c0_seq1.p1 gnl/TRDRNA2_/TRDRNA2_185860_c0~~gnl/TRDRNA2_/TRDRNA2_185860_c0_seq1.p1  ORF type:complete len:419 (+),score=58.50 gnl/TRDRNA2_/TRDRNA2_185860_c0_seq1:60-1316(+)